MAQQEFNTAKIIPIAIVVGVILLIILSWNSISVNIDAGHAGVKFRRFQGGLELGKTYGEGFHFIAPWDKMYDYEVRQQEIAEEMNILSSNGLEIQVDVSAWYQPTFDNLSNLHSEIGINYLQRVVIPSLRSSARSVVGRYTPEQIYSTKRDAIQDEIFEETKLLLEKKNVQINQILIRSIKLPPTIKKAIESKLEQEQLSLEYEFKITKASQEAERQRIEAEGKAAANDIINASLSDRILREKGILATLELAKSENTKVVVIGNAKDGMPLILGDAK